MMVFRIQMLFIVILVNLLPEFLSHFDDIVEMLSACNLLGLPIHDGAVTILIVEIKHEVGVLVGSREVLFRMSIELVIGDFAITISVDTKD